MFGKIKEFFFVIGILCLLPVIITDALIHPDKWDDSEFSEDPDNPYAYFKSYRG